MRQRPEHKAEEVINLMEMKMKKKMNEKSSSVVEVVEDD